MYISVYISEAKSLALTFSVNWIYDSQKVKALLSGFPQLCLHYYYHFQDDSTKINPGYFCYSFPGSKISGSRKGIAVWEGKVLGRPEIAIGRNEKALLELVCFWKLHFSGSLHCWFILTQWKTSEVVSSL